MKTVFVGLSILLALVGYSQSSLTVFNNGGQKFFLIMNGIKQNSVAQTNVVVSGIKKGGYSVKLIFEDGKTKDIDKNFFLDSPQDVTTKVAFKKGVGKLQLVSMVAASGTAPAGSVTYRPDNTAVYSDAVTTTTTTTTTQTVTTESSSISSGNSNGNNGNGNGSVGIQIVTPTPVPNETPTNQGNGGVNIQFNDPNQQQNLNMNIDINGVDPNAPNMNVNMNVNGTNTNTNVNAGTTTNTSTQQTTTNGGNVNVNVSGNGVNPNVNTTVPGTTTNVNINGGTVQNSSNSTVTTTTTTTNTTTTTVNGSTSTNNITTSTNAGGTNNGGTSNGRMVCSKTLTNVETLKTELNGYSFEDDRVDALKISLKNKCLYAADAVKVMDLFTFDANQLEVAKFLSDHLLDYDNASSLAAKFSFDSSKMEYMEYVGRE